MVEGIRNSYFPLQEETEKIIQICIEVHKILGFGFLELIYKDALQYEFTNSNILFEREKPYVIKYKELVFKRVYHADFVVFNSVILELKAKQCMIDEDVKQVINYLKCSDCKVGLIVNFGRNKIEIKRIVL